MTVKTIDKDSYKLVNNGMQVILNNGVSSYAMSSKDFPAFVDELCKARDEWFPEPEIQDIGVREHIRQHILGADVFDKLMNDLDKFLHDNLIFHVRYIFDIDHEGDGIINIKLLNIDDSVIVVNIDNYFNDYMAHIGDDFEWVGKCAILFT